MIACMWLYSSAAATAFSGALVWCLAYTAVLSGTCGARLRHPPAPAARRCCRSGQQLWGCVHTESPRWAAHAALPRCSTDVRHYCCRSPAANVRVRCVRAATAKWVHRSSVRSVAPQSHQGSQIRHECMHETDHQPDHLTSTAPGPFCGKYLNNSTAGAFEHSLQATDG